MSCRTTETCMHDTNYNTCRAESSSSKTYLTACTKTVLHFARGFHECSDSGIVGLLDAQKLGLVPRSCWAVPAREDDGILLLRVLVGLLGVELFVGLRLRLRVRRAFALLPNKPPSSLSLLSSPCGPFLRRPFRRPFQKGRSLSTAPAMNPSPWSVPLAVVDRRVVHRIHLAAALLRLLLFAQEGSACSASLETPGFCCHPSSRPPNHSHHSCPWPCLRLRRRVLGTRGCWLAFDLGRPGPRFGASTRSPISSASLSAGHSWWPAWQACPSSWPSNRAGPDAAHSAVASGHHSITSNRAKEKDCKKCSQQLRL